MDITAALARCSLHVRQNTFLKEPDWRMLLNDSQMEIQSQTHINRGTFFVQLEQDVAFYSLASARIYSILEPMKDTDDNALPLMTRGEMEAYDLSETGKPTYVYEAGQGRIGVYSVPSEAYGGTRIRGYGLMWPEPITADTSLGTQLAFEEMFHNNVVLGAVLMAERIDTDITIAREIQGQYDRGLLAMRFVARTRMPGTSRTIPSGR